MENINSIFLKNSFTSYPNKIKKQNTPKYKDVFDKKDNDAYQYLDILYSEKMDNSTDTISLTDFFKTYLPMNSKKLHFGEFFL